MIFEGLIKKLIKFGKERKEEFFGGCPSIIGRAAGALGVVGGVSGEKKEEFRRTPPIARVNKRQKRYRSLWQNCVLQKSLR